MNRTRSIVTSTRPTAIRGGRLRKRGGQVVSFAPHFADLLSGASRVALGGVLILAGVAALAPSTAMAGDCTAGPNDTVLCSGPADPDGNDTRIVGNINTPGLVIETVAGFGINSSNSYGAAIELTNSDDADIIFVDENASEITGSNIGIAAYASGSGNISITTNGTIASDNNSFYPAILAVSYGSGDVSVSLTDSGSASGNNAIVVIGTDTATGDLSVTTSADSTLATTDSAINAWHYGDGNVNITTAGTISSANNDAINAYLAGAGDINVTNSAELNAADHGITAWNNAAEDTLGNVTITNSGAITSGNIGIAGLSNADGNVTITNSADINSANQSIRAWQVGKGDIIVDNSGTLTSDTSFGISAFTDDQGMIDVTNSGTINAVIGMHAQHDASGTLQQSNSGTINATVGMNAVAYGDANIILGNEATGEINSIDSGITATHYGDGDISITNAGVVSNTMDQNDPSNVNTDRHALYALHSGTGNISITNSGTVNALMTELEPDGDNFGSSHAIIGDHSGTGDIIIDNSGTINSVLDGIGAAHTGVGNIIITNTGTINADEDGIFTTRQGNYLTADEAATISITNDAAIIAGADGIRTIVRNDNDGPNFVNVSVVNNGNILSTYESINVDMLGELLHGDASVNNTGNITSTYDDAIIIEHGGTGNITVNNSGTINAYFDAIDISHYGVGDIIITTQASSILNADDNGIEAYHDGIGDISITNTGAIMAAYNGIIADHDGDGDIIVTNSGAITADEDGIITDHDGNGDIIVTNSGAITADGDGINADHDGDGDIIVTNSGTINAESDGIDAYHNSFGDIIITTTATSVLNSGDNGVEASHIGRGDISITTAGRITADNNGIYANHYDDGSLTVNNAATITANDNGVDVYHNGLGDIIVDNAGTINAGQRGIYAQHENEGHISITNNGSINALSMGIAASHDGEGNINIVNNGTVRGGEYAGIGAAHLSTGDISITNTATVSGSLAGIYAATDYGNITISNSGNIANTASNSAANAIFAVANNETLTHDVTISNSGTITGTITTAGDREVYNNDTLEYDTISVSGDDTVTNSGTWNTAGGTNDFGAGDDIVTNTGTISAANASFVGLENFVNNGTLTMVNNVAGDTLTTDGDMAFGADSRLIVEIDGNNIDNVTADGDISLDGELVLAQTGARGLASRYTILSANNIDGQFASDNIQDTAFLDLELDYSDPTRVDLTITQVADFADVAQTPNQIATADVLDTLPSGNNLIDEMLYLPDAAAARTALDQLSGEVHATQHTALADDSRLPRNAVLNRLQNQDGSTIWGELFFGNGDLDQAKNRNTGSSKRDAWGFILGADAAITDNVVVGLAGSMIKHESDNQLRSNLTNSEIETAHLLAYVGAESGKARFKLGAGYAWGDVTTARTVNFGRFTDRLTADYDAKLFQAFAELGYRLPLGGGYVEPMANVIYIDTTTDAFTENGGLAALSAEKRSENTTLSTLGARFSTAQSGIFSLNGMVGWQHGFGKLTPSSVLNFANFAGSDSFTIAGAPQSRDAAVMQVEAKLDAGSNMSVGLGYDGILGTAGHDHAAKISVRMKF